MMIPKNKPLKEGTIFLRLAAVLFLAAGLCMGCPLEDGGYEQSAAPEAAVDTISKTAQTQKSVTFRLTSVHDAGSVWKVYDTDEGGGVLTTVRATYKKTLNPEDGEPVSDLILTSFTNDLEAITYYVSVTGRDRAESERLALMVNPL
ncbi:MAG: hypothetical protein LBS57_01470 [Treponema sp.]|jgi:hypothetical protein|nr:hypothetical protein [Treponema sp.]